VAPDQYRMQEPKTIRAGIGQGRRLGVERHRLRQWRHGHRRVSLPGVACTPTLHLYAAGNSADRAAPAPRELYLCQRVLEADREDGDVVAGSVSDHVVEHGIE
jgi:hypothetical protein